MLKLKNTLLFSALLVSVNAYSLSCTTPDPQDTNTGYISTDIAYASPVTTVNGGNWYVTGVQALIQKGDNTARWRAAAVVMNSSTFEVLEIINECVGDSAKGNGTSTRSCSFTTPSKILLGADTTKVVGVMVKTDTASFFTYSSSGDSQTVSAAEACGTGCSTAFSVLPTTTGAAKPVVQLDYEPMFYESDPTTGVKTLSNIASSVAVSTDRKNLINEDVACFSGTSNPDSLVWDATNKVLRRKGP